MSHQFGKAFFLVGLLSAPSFPCGKYGADYPLNGVKVAQVQNEAGFLLMAYSALSFFVVNNFQM